MRIASAVAPKLLTNLPGVGQNDPVAAAAQRDKDPVDLRKAEHGGQVDIIQFDATAGYQIGELGPATSSRSPPDISVNAPAAAPSLRCVQGIDQQGVAEAPQFDRAGDGIGGVVQGHAIVAEYECAGRGQSAAPGAWAIVPSLLSEH